MSKGSHAAVQFFAALHICIRACKHAYAVPVCTVHAPIHYPLMLSKHVDVSTCAYAAQVCTVHVPIHCPVLLFKLVMCMHNMDMC